MHILFKNGDEIIHGVTDFVKLTHIGYHSTRYVRDSYEIYEASFTVNNCIYTIRIAGCKKDILGEMENIDKISFIFYQNFYDDHEGEYENIVDVEDFTQHYEGDQHQYQKTDEGYYLINGMYVYPDGKINPENKFGYAIGNDNENIFDFWFYIRGYDGVSKYVSDKYQNLFIILEQSVQSGIHDDKNLPISNYDKVKFMKDVTNYSMTLNPGIYHGVWGIYSNTYKDVDFSEFE